MINTTTLTTDLSSFGTVELCQYDTTNTNLYIQLGGVTIAQNDLDIAIDELMTGEFNFRTESTLINQVYKIVYTTV